MSEVDWILSQWGFSLCCLWAGLLGFLLTEQSEASFAWTCKGFLVLLSPRGQNYNVQACDKKSKHECVCFCTCALIVQELYVCFSLKYVCIKDLECMCVYEEVRVCVCQKHLETRRCDFTGCDRMKYCSEEREREKQKTTDGAALSETVKSRLFHVVFSPKLYLKSFEILCFMRIPFYKIFFFNFTSQSNEINEKNILYCLLYW